MGNIPESDLQDQFAYRCAALVNTFHHVTHMLEDNESIHCHCHCQRLPLHHAVINAVFSKMLFIPNSKFAIASQCFGGGAIC